MRLSLTEFHTGVETAGGNCVAFDVANGVAHFGAARVDGHVLVWDLTEQQDAHDAALLAREIELAAAADWVMRCDRIDFPPGGVAYQHTHPGPGIRYLLHGRLEIETGGHTTDHGPGEAWFESGLEPVLATAAADEPTAFVRVLILPAEWAGKRTICYVDPADEDRPKLQKPTVFLEQSLTFA